MLALASYQQGQAMYTDTDMWQIIIA